MDFFFECHDALEPLWLSAKGEEKLNLQSLILLAAGFHHIQHQNAAGAQAVWKDALGRLKGQDRLTLSTGNLEIHESLKALDYIALELDSGDASDWGRFGNNRGLVGILHRLCRVAIGLRQDTPWLFQR